MATDLIINIASQFTGKSAFEKAEKSTKLLTKSVKNLAKVTGVALSATAILAYSKKSIKAAADDMKAQKLLAQSLKNVGLAYATVNVENFIGQLQKQTGILDDETLSNLVKEHFDLRPWSIIQQFDLKNLPAKNEGSFYKNVAAYGHFGRFDIDLPWEKLDQVEALKKKANQLKNIKLQTV